MWAVVVDIATGDFSYASKDGNPPYRSLPPGSILPGPDGAYTQLILPSAIAYAMWVRPGVGMWVGGPYNYDADEEPRNDCRFMSVAQFAAGQTSKEVRVLVLGDSDVEAAETFRLLLSNPVHATLSRATAEGLIVDDDGSARTIRVTGVRVREKTGSPVSAVFPVLLGGSVPEEVRVSYETVDGTARAGSDYVAASGVLVFASGETRKEIAVPVVGDSDDEPRESFNVRLSNAVNATIVASEAEGVIDDDDVPPLPVLTVAGVEVRESDSGFVDATFTLSLSIVQPSDVHVDAATVNRTATAGSDYEHRAERIVFAAGQTSRAFTVRVMSDDKAEATETFGISLSSAHMTVPAAQPLATIVDDDAASRKRAVRR